MLNCKWHSRKLLPATTDCTQSCCISENLQDWTSSPSASLCHLSAVFTLEWTCSLGIWDGTAAQSVSGVRWWVIPRVQAVPLALLHRSCSRRVWASMVEGLHWSASGSFHHTFACPRFPSSISPNRRSRWGNWTRTTWLSADRFLLQSSLALDVESGLGKSYK